MTRIAGRSLAEIQFRQNDTPPTRAQKLELIREIVIEIINNLPDDEPDPDPIGDGTEAYRIPGYFVETPLADYTLHLHSVTNDILFFPAFAGSQAHCGIAPTDDYVMEIFRNPTFTGLEITGAEELLGWLTFGADGSVTWATVDDLPKQVLKADCIGIKAPGADATVALGSFTLYALIQFALQAKQFSGDQHEEGGVVFLSGDQEGFIIYSGDQQYG